MRGVTRRCISNFLLVLISRRIPYQILNTFYCNKVDVSGKCNITEYGEIFSFFDFSRWGSAPSAMSLRTSARTPVRGRGRVVRRGARGGTSGWAIGSRVVPATAVPEELVNQVSVF